MSGIKSIDISGVVIFYMLILGAASTISVSHDVIVSTHIPMASFSLILEVESKT